MAKTKSGPYLAPLGDRVLIEADKARSESKGGIIIPDTAKEKPLRGRVLAVGPGRTEDGVLVPMRVKAGDVVLYTRYAGHDIEVDGEEYKIVDERDILAFVIG